MGPETLIYYYPQFRMIVKQFFELATKEVSGFFPLLRAFIDKGLQNR